ncbi:hypothetical protein BTN49_0994 [Candidatus Enterovibrio escicola]|uniref:Uncharacterized protein n=1 Tax=Candidatus Enterovibrio escicola TaxID=1927127 RepID=A0A2A5T5G5_9GAMM|nr:hypothetical protein BTN49_0994 [Candidatus Enterovibrio escacola]
MYIKKERSYIAECKFFKSLTSRVYLFQAGKFCNMRDNNSIGVHHAKRGILHKEQTVECMTIDINRNII